MAKMGRPKSENAKKKTLSIRVEDALYERICNYAEQHQLTVTEVVLQGLDKVCPTLNSIKPFFFREGELIWQQHEKTCGGVPCEKARCSAAPISGMRILTRTRWDGANTSTQMIL